MTTPLPARIGLLAATLLFCFSAQAAPGDQGRRGYDPMNHAERQAAARHAERRAQKWRGRRAAGTGNLAAQAAGTPPDELQLLLVERRPSKNALVRQSDLYQYDYTRDELVHSVVDLTSDRVLSSERSQGVQLPLVPVEIAWATSVLMSSPTERRMVRRAFRQITGQRLTDIAQIDFKAFVFHASSGIDQSAALAQQCGLHRCAQLLLYTKDNVSLDLSPIVDLSTGVVIDVLLPVTGAAGAMQNLGGGHHGN